MSVTVICNSCGKTIQPDDMIKCSKCEEATIRLIAELEEKIRKLKNVLFRETYQEDGC